MTNTIINKVKTIISREGGFRERELLKAKNLEFFKGDTWNAEHKIIDVLGDAEPDGHRPGCAVDIQAGKITG